MTARDQGLAALRAGDAGSAALHLRTAVQETPDDAQAWGGLGIALSQLQRPADGLRALERAVSLAPGHAGLQYNLGRTLELLERPADARAAYARAAAAEGGHAQAAVALERLRAEAGAPVGPSPTPAAGPPPAPQPVTAPAQSPSPPPLGLGDFQLPGMTPAAPAAAAGAAVAPDPAVSAAPNPAAWAVPPPVACPAPYGAAPAPSPALPPLGAPPGVPQTPAPNAYAPSSGGSALKGGLSVAGGLAALLLFGVLRFGRLAYRLWEIAHPATRASAPATPTVGGLPAPLSSGFGGPGGFGPASATSHIDLNSTAPGPVIDDRANGFRATLPNGFPRPSPTERPEHLGFGAMATKVIYDASSSSGECFVLCVGLAPDTFDKAGNDKLFAVGKNFLTNPGDRVQGTQPVQHQTYAAEETRYETMSAGAFRPGRGRTIIARPRVFVIGFEGTDEAAVNSPAVTQFIQSLAITDGVTPAGVSEGIQIPHRAAPTFSPPAMPRPPGYPAGPMGPGATRAAPGTSDVPPMPGAQPMPAGPSFGPGEPPYGPYGPRGPGIPTGPRFSPMGPQGTGVPTGPTGGPPFGPGVRPPFGPP
jgi:hypothetical protein